MKKWTYDPRLEEMYLEKERYKNMVDALINSGEYYIEDDGSYEWGYAMGAAMETSLTERAMFVEHFARMAIWAAWHHHGQDMLAALTEFRHEISQALIKWDDLAIKLRSKEHRDLFRGEVSRFIDAITAALEGDGGEMLKSNYKDDPHAQLFEHWKDRKDPARINVGRRVGELQATSAHYKKKGGHLEAGNFIMKELRIKKRTGSITDKERGMLKWLEDRQNNKRQFQKEISRAFKDAESLDKLR